MLPLVVFLLLIIAAGQIIGAVYILAGIGWALLCLGLATLAFAALIARGISRA